jgi:UDP-glucose 4-epimerase
LIALVKSGIPLPLASVRNRRSFIGVQNLSDLILKCLGNEKALDRTFYPCDAVDVSTPTLIKSLAEAFEFRARLFPFPEPLLRTAANLPGMSMLRKLMASLYVDSEPLKNDLGWVPALTLNQGLRLIAAIPEEHNRDEAQDGTKK